MIEKIAKTAILAASLLLVGCGSDNAYDGTNLIGGNPSASQADALISIQENVFKKHADGLLESITAMKQRVDAFDSNLTTGDITALQGEFNTIMQEWKSVEASYIAAEYDDALIDTPQFIDYYHTGKKLDVGADIESALSQTTDIETALFKNSSKSITALEYLLFGNTATVDALVTKMNQNNQRAVSALQVVLQNLETRAFSIADFYQSDTKFTSDAVDASNALVNTLIDSAYKLKEWRVGEASGIAVKYADDPDPSRLEYAKSRLSLVAIEAILETHDEIMGEQEFSNFGSFASENGAGAIVTQIREQIDEALALTAEFDTPLEDVITTTAVDPKMQELYANIKELQRLYFESLIQALDLTAEIIEADGD